MAEHGADSLPLPFVSIGIPTYNRCAELARAAESVLGQSHGNLELVISDNASEDGTQSLCERLRERDKRVRYMRALVNRGPTANFNELFDRMRGDFLMVLSDDDWLHQEYVACCLSAFARDRRLALACCRARYLRDGAVVREGAEMQLADGLASHRILAYLRDVDENGLFYGLMRRDTLRRAAPLTNAVGNDWLLVARALAQGTACTLDGACIYRELDGTSADFAKLTATLHLPAWQARVPHLVIAWNVLADIAWRADAYDAISPASRLVLAARAGWRAIRWPSLAWHALTPIFRGLADRPAGRWLWRAYLRVARLLGAGRGGD